MRYGIGYLGSKNDIAERLIAVLPPAETFVDLFAGGCAMTHCAMLSGKYKRFIINDISDAPTLFLDAIAGKYANETRWISREDFFRLKDSDPYVKYGWSFGNNGNNYIYGRHIEAYKKAYHYAVFFNDFSLFEAIGIIIPEHTKALMDAMPNNTERRLVLRRYIVKHKSLIKAALKEHALKENRPADLQSLERLERLQSLQSLERLQNLERLQSLQSDYSDVTVPSDALVYCDPPYKDTDCHSYSGFDHERFYDWLRADPMNKYISEYAMPDDFVCIAEFPKMIKSGSNGQTYGVERLFVHRDFDAVRIKTTLF